MKKQYTTYKSINLPNLSQEILKYWDANEIFKRSVSEKDSNKPYVFFEGPPSANGLPGIHHAMGRSIKDIFCRYKTLKGYQVRRKAGWDTHGLPVELGVEKELGIKKVDIGTKISEIEYNQKCKESVMRYTDVWNNLTRQLGYWVDMSDPYITYDSKYMESVWWLLGQVYKKGLMYKGYTIQPYSPAAGTGLSTHELNQPGCYKDVSDTTVVAQFETLPETLPEQLRNISENIFFLAWTTTPWTLPSNTALAVGKKIDYTLIETFNQYTHEKVFLVLATELINYQFSKKYKAVESAEELNAYQSGDKKIPYYIHTSCKGADLVGIKYHQLFDFQQPAENPEEAFRVISGDFVTTKDGTGIVHIAPTFGADDAQVAKEAGVPAMLIKDEKDELIPLVNLQGKFVDGMGNYSNMFVKNEYYPEGEAPEKSIDVQLAIELKERNRAFKVEKYNHNYPHCWRTNKPILYYPLDSWFIKVPEVREELVSLNETINWKPKATGEGRFGNWLKEANDWNLSRSRYWGIPLPIWRNAETGEEIIIDSIENLKEEIQKSISAGLMTEDPFANFVVGDMSKDNYAKVDLHKHIVDKIVLVSNKGTELRRDPDLIDVWFDSGSMPFAQWHYPFENKELIDNNENYPADFIAEGVDQTRGWFYTLHTISTIVKGSVAYKNVVSNGLVLDEKGNKMSKSKGNVVDPFEVFEEFGPDAARWYMISNAQPWDNLKFDKKGITEVQRKLFGTIHNTYSFFALYANLDGFAMDEEMVKHEERPEMDRWILSELQTLIQTVDNYFKQFEPTLAARAINDFVNDKLSNWYVRLNRRRFWKGEYNQDKISAYQTLYSCLENLAIISSPIAPFYFDRLYQDLSNVGNKNAQDSVHLADFPVPNESWIDKSLEEKMQFAQKTCSLILSLRQKEKLKVRQPLQKVMIPIDNPRAKEILLEMRNIILSEVNIKDIELLEDNNNVLVKNIKPNFKALGPKFGKQMKNIAQKVNGMNQEDIQTIEQNGAITLEVGGENIELSLEDVEIQTKDIPGWSVATVEGLTVALDITLTDALKEEGLARDIINRIQNIRKDMDLELTDKIIVKFQKEEQLKKSVDNFGKYIADEVLANDIIFENTLENGIELDIDGYKIYLNVSKV
ncbi:MAG: isoleucine--tRNA ligase [Flavobacteriales bacterium]|nr:isoleucine--tRNA ligase [Flavobacteriales bacterium]